VDAWPDKWQRIDLYLINNLLETLSPASHYSPSHPSLLHFILEPDKTKSEARSLGVFFVSFLAVPVQPPHQKAVTKKSNREKGCWEQSIYHEV